MSQLNKARSIFECIADANNEKQPETMRATEVLDQPCTVGAADTEATDSYFNEITILEKLEPPNQVNLDTRTIQRKTRLSKTEDEKFLMRVEQSGKSQSDFIREAVLYDKIYSLYLPREALAACEIIMNEGGRIKSLSGMMVQSLMQNKQYQSLTREEILTVNDMIRQVKDIGDRMIRKGDEINGHLQTLAVHNLSYGAAVEYLTKQHNETTYKPILDAGGKMIERPEYLIEGINCIPDTWARNCWRDARKYGKNHMANEVKTHQYIISFAPEDRAKGLTLEECMAEGRAIAEKYFAGHRVLLCAHPDGDNKSGNVHVHIIVCSIRCAARDPNPIWMRLRADGSIKPSEYKAGCKHQDTAVLRHRIDDDLREFCKARGYAYLPEGYRAPRKRSVKEAKAKQSGQRRLDRENIEREASDQPIQQTEFHTQQDELRLAVEEAAKKSSNVSELRQHLQNDFFRTVELIAADGKRRKEQQRIAFDVKFSRGRISYKHPDAKDWVRGKTLGALYDEKAIQKALTANKKRQRTQPER